jgi:membrane fusion protein (multidrug efflux system)
MDTREADKQKTAPTAQPNGTGRHTAESVPQPATRESVPPQPPPAEAGPRPRKRILFALGGLIVVILVLIWGVPWLLYMLSHQGTDDARVDADAVAVTSKIDEKIDHILVDTNQPVHRGQLLIVLDQKDELAKLRQARAQYDLAVANQRTTTQQGHGGVSEASGNVANAQAQVPVAQAGVAQAQAQLRAAEAQLPAAQESYVKASADLARTSSLVSTGDVASEQLDAMRAEDASAAASERAASDQINVDEANLTAAQQRVAASGASVTAATGTLMTAQGRLAQAADPSQVESAQAALYLAKQNLGYTHIRSAIDGYVGEKSAEVGQTVSAGATLMTLIPHRVYITANYKETQMGNMKVGQPVDVHVDAYRGVTFHGHVASINPASQNTYALVPAQNATGNFVKVTQRIPVRIYVDDARADMPLRPGMSVETYVKVK